MRRGGTSGEALLRRLCGGPSDVPGEGDLYVISSIQFVYLHTSELSYLFLLYELSPGVVGDIVATEAIVVARP